jgi:hypothetical protein
MTMASPAPRRANIPGSKRATLLLACASPPNPVCAAPNGMTPICPSAEARVVPAAPAAVPVLPVTPEPTPAFGAVEPAAGVPAGLAVPPVPEVGAVGVLVGVGGVPGVVGVVGVVVGVVGALGIVVVVVVGTAAKKLLVKLTVQVTVLPPPLAEPLHWLMERGRAVAPPLSVHFTRVDPPPPLPDPLHWVTVAPEVLDTGAQTRIGWVPPPVPEPMH